MQQSIHPSLVVVTSIMLDHHLVNVVGISYDCAHHPPVDSCALSDTEIINDISDVIIHIVVCYKIIVPTMKFTTQVQICIIIKYLKYNTHLQLKKSIVHNKQVYL